MIELTDTFSHLNELEAVIPYTFDNKNLLILAMTHRSYTNENESIVEHNERLEFLGDAILGHVITEYIFHQFSHFSEGELSSIRAKLICKESLADIARDIQLGKYILLGRGEQNNGGHKRDALLADTLESLFASIYLDSNTETIRQIILDLYQKIEKFNFDQQPIKEFKNILQEYTQLHLQCSPEYQTISAIGPDHAKWYEVSVNIRDEIKGVGRGPSKKEAEKNAAQDACIKLDLIL